MAWVTLGKQSFALHQSVSLICKMSWWPQHRAQAEAADASGGWLWDVLYGQHPGLQSTNLLLTLENGREFAIHKKSLPF